MELSILGPLELTVAGEPRVVAGGRQRDLLALLALEAGRAVSAERLIDGVWGDRPPAHPGNALQQQVFALRRLLRAEPSAPGAPNESGAAGAADVLATVPGGYRLDVPDDAIDARRFERLADEGARALATGAVTEAARSLADALALWRGEALAGIDAPWARDEATRLEERRLTATEDRIDADLALGRHATSVAELEGLVATSPLRERLRGQLMLALAGSGRQAEALTTYEAARRLLADELGIDPSPQLQAVHAAVLRQRVSGGVAAFPRPVGSFVGRDDELRRLGALLASERIVTLTGPGGAGKTRLALEAAQQVGRAAPQRTLCLADLSVVRDAGAVPAAVAAALGVRGSQDVPLVDALHGALSTREILLVLDNCEHLLDAASSLVHQLVTTHPGLRILATSREPLGVVGEVVWPLPTLEVPAPGAHARHEVERVAAIQLFLDRAREVVPELTVDEADLAAIARIVRELDGLPLAIELAAARVRVLSVRDLAERLHDRFRVLAGGRRGLPARHRTLHATLEWSWELLGEDERLAWSVAAVPVAPFPLDLLGTLLEAAGCDLPALEAVTALGDRSLLEVHERTSPTRYRMLETVREFGAEQLERAGLDEVVRAAHATAVEAALASADRTTSLHWDVDLELHRRWLPEARAALRWRQAQGDLRGVQRLAAGLGWTWLLTAQAPEGLRWLDAGIGPIEDVDPETVEPAAVAWAANLRINEAPHDPGLRWAQLAVDVVPGAGADTAAGGAAAVGADAAAGGAAAAVQRVLAGVAIAAQRATGGDLDGGLAEIRARSGAGGGEGWIAGFWALLEGQLLAVGGDTVAAEPLLARAERLLLDHGAWWGVWTSATLVQLAEARGDLATVRAVADRALPVCEERGSPELEVELRGVLAMVEADVGDLDAAEGQLQRAQALVDRTGVGMSRALVAAAGGYVAWRAGRPDDATAAFAHALETHERPGQPFGPSFVRWALAHLALDRGEVAAARDLVVAALRDAVDRAEREAIARALEGVAAVLLAEGEPLGAVRAFGAAEGRLVHPDGGRPLLAGVEFAATGERVEAALLQAMTGDPSAGRAEQRRLGEGVRPLPGELAEEVRAALGRLGEEGRRLGDAELVTLVHSAGPNRSGRVASTT